jgi:threonine dehydrogenase-like Zn-dependent dehydrogenase
LLRLIEGGRIDPTVFATHHLRLGDTEEAYDIFAAASETGALKVVLQADPAVIDLDDRRALATATS